MVTAKLTNMGILPNGSQRYFCPACQQTFTERFDPLYYYRHLSPEQIRQVLQADSEGSSLRGSSRITELASNTGVGIVSAASQQAQLVDNTQVMQVNTEEVSAAQMWSFVENNNSNVSPQN